MVNNCLAHQTDWRLLLMKWLMRSEGWGSLDVSRQVAINLFLWGKWMFEGRSSSKVITIPGYLKVGIFTLTQEISRKRDSTRVQDPMEWSRLHHYVISWILESVYFGRIMMPYIADHVVNAADRQQSTICTCLLCVKLDSKAVDRMNRPRLLY